MSGQGVRRVVIAGGGTAGWIAAAALGKQLGALLEIILVESEEIGTVGVGESTIPTARSFHQIAGVDEAEFIRATGSTFKLGISFEDWARVGDRYFHSFGQIGRSTWIADFHHFWLEARAKGYGGDLSDYCLELQAAKAGRFATGGDANISYAYHLDAGLYARYLRQLAEAAGVRRIEGKIAEVTRHPESGDIAALVLQSGERVEGDLFIDCTGFRALLIEGALEAGFEDWSHWLPTDSAVVVQTAAVEPARPYTRAIAHQAGWQWRIPLQHRVGNGFVYASAHLSDDEARAKLIGSLQGEMLMEPRLLRFRAGRRRRMWVGNCVALGLSSGFVEPLESTSIHLIMVGVTRLLQLFPFSGADDALRARYEAQAQNELERIRDFIILHYRLSERDDGEFWRHCRTMEIPDSLAERIALFRESAHAYQSADDLFRVDSWVQVMLGQRLQPRSHHAVARIMASDQLQSALREMKGNIATAVQRLPQHQDFLRRYSGEGASSVRSQQA